MNRFERKVVDALGDWSAYRGGVFYKLPVKHIACCFTLEKKSFGHIIHMCNRPICDRDEDLSYLSFGKMLPGEDGFIPLDERLTPDSFTKRIKPHIETVTRLGDLTAFVNEFADSGRVIESKRRSYATVLILLGRYEEATRDLRECIDDHVTYRVGYRNSPYHEAYLQNTRALLQALEKDPASAVALLGEWEAETKRKFKIP